MSDQNETPVVVAEPAPAPAVEVAPPKKKFIVNIFLKCMRGIKVVILLPFFIFRRKRDPDAIMLYSATPGFFLWFLIAFGFVFAAIIRWKPGADSVLSWTYAWLTIYFITSLIYDISAKRLALWIVVFGCFWFGLKYVEHVSNLFVLGAIATHLRNLDAMVNPGYMSFIGWLMLIPFLHSIFYLFAYGRKRFTPNEIAEFHFMEGNELSDRMGMRFAMRYRDLLETLLTFGGGDLVAMDNHQKEIKRYPNILFLYFVWPRLSRILEQRSVVENAGCDDVPVEHPNIV